MTDSYYKSHSSVDNIENVFRAFSCFSENKFIITSNKILYSKLIYNLSR